MNKICESCRKTTHKTHEVSEDLFQYMLFEKNGKLNEMKAMKAKQLLQINSLIKSLLNVKNIIQQEIIDISEIMRNNETLLRKMKDFIVVDNYKPIKLTNWLYYIDNQHFSYFLYLNLIHKQNLHNLYGETKKD